MVNWETVKRETGKRETVKWETDKTTLGKNGNRNYSGEMGL